MTITDLETWLIDNDERIYRYLVYKRMFTPYEQQRAFEDETIFEDDYYTLAKITEAIDLGNGEWLLGFTSVDRDTLRINQYTEYYKLSEIRLSYFGDEKKIRDVEEDE